MVILPGTSHMRGATWDGRGSHFALWSGVASAVELCLFDDSGAESARLPLQRGEGDVFGGYVPGAAPGQRYGYRVHGPYALERGQRCNPNKLLLDPYARALAGAARWDALHFGGGEQPDPCDDGPVAPHSVVIDPDFDWEGDAPPRVPIGESVIYECHVKGLTALHPEVAPASRGRFLGLASEPVIAHLRALGVTAVELMPVQQAYSERFLVERGLSNYWGYNTIGFFAPDARFAQSSEPGAAVREFKTMVRALHRAGIEVILDVVYNHTGEADEHGPTLCLRGIDNAAYYHLDPNDLRRYRDFTGCGNTVNLAHPEALRLVADSLRYWVQDMHVDGFRFDLAPALARDARGAVDLARGLFAIIDADPVLGQVKRIAEPWDAAGGIALGGFPLGWAEWNGRYRDAVRRFFRGDAGARGELATRLAGSSDLFARAGRGPAASVNFAACHDGFTLHDLTSYAHKHNQQNGWDDRDGENDNASRNFGVEGPTELQDVRELRARTVRSLLATVALSLGVPMIQQGDEMGRTQHGNNNPYGHDAELGWVHWDLSAEQRGLLAFARRCFALRRELGMFRRARHFDAAPMLGGAGGDAPRDVAWLRPEGGELAEHDWADPDARGLAMWTCGHDAAGRPDPALPSALLLLNGGDGALQFRLPQVPGGFRIALDSADAARAGTLARDEIAVAAHGVCLLRAAGGSSGGRA
jgi:glycogen operon protein